MKSTGVVRKIDHLGRIVIPKEVRKSLKIKDGESLEIGVEEDTIFLKKISSLNGLQNFATYFVEIISLLLKKNLIITDMSEVIACSKELSSKYLNQDLNSEYLKILDKRETYIATDTANISIVLDEGLSAYYLLIPIVVQGDLVGSIFLFSEKDKIEEKDKLLLKFVTQFFEKNLEV